MGRGLPTPVRRIACWVAERSTQQLPPTDAVRRPHRCSRQSLPLQLHKLSRSTVPPTPSAVFISVHCSAPTHLPLLAVQTVQAERADQSCLLRTQTGVLARASRGWCVHLCPSARAEAPAQHAEGSCRVQCALHACPSTRHLSCLQMAGNKYITRVFRSRAGGVTGKQVRKAAQSIAGLHIGQAKNKTGRGRDMVGAMRGSCAGVEIKR